MNAVDRAAVAIGITRILVPLVEVLLVVLAFVFGGPIGGILFLIIGLPLSVAILKRILIAVLGLWIAPPSSRVPQDMAADEVMRMPAEARQIPERRVELKEVRGPIAGREWLVPDTGMWIVTNILIKFMPVASGSFDMGSNDGKPDERPVHRVSITSDYWLEKAEVTQAEFEMFIKDSAFRTQAERQGWSYVWDGISWEKEKGSYWKSMFIGSGRPVTCVSWEDAVAYCDWLTARERRAGRLPDGYEYRLPTEAEWEYAARGGAQSRGHKYSGSENAGEVAWYSDNSGSKPHPVREKSANELGLYDMSGNVWEWCLDRYDYEYYGKSADVDPVNMSEGSYRVLRGGSWSDPAGSVLSANRAGFTPTGTNNNMGFRVCFARRSSDLSKQ